MYSMVIIPIGDTCNITFLLQNAKIKKQTTLFEWFVSKKLNYITDILNKLANHENPNLTIYGNYLFLDSIYSDHYTLSNFNEIYKRRRDRLIETIVNNNDLLFIRFESNHNECVNEIDEFINAVKRINPNANTKLFMIAPKKIEHPLVHTELYNAHSQDPYCKTNEINELFINGLLNMGYSMDTTDLSFNDYSII